MFPTIKPQAPCGEAEIARAKIALAAESALQVGLEELRICPLETVRCRQSQDTGHNRLAGAGIDSSLAFRADKSTGQLNRFPP
jgi:hypothetical protein